MGASIQNLKIRKSEFSMKTIKSIALALIALPLFAHAQPNDAQIAAIVVTANQVDIDAGKYAEVTSQNSTIKSFASTMIADHSAVNRSAVELVTKLKVTPEANATSQSLQEGGDANLARLRTLSGTEFDRAYVDHEVAYHEQVIQAIETVLIPNAKNAELKALLVKVLPTIKAHLGHAKNMQATLK